MRTDKNVRVTYHNDLNSISMRDWTPEEMNFFFAIISQSKNIGTNEITLDKYDLTELVNYSLEHKQRFYNTMENLANHIIDMRYIEKTNSSIEMLSLFSRFKVDWTEDLSDMNVTVAFSDGFEYIVNKLNANFTQYELEEFTRIRSTYAKTAYRLLKQWRTVGKKEYNINEFKFLMGMPETYKTSHIDNRVLAPIKKELSVFFKGLKIKKIKSNKKGNPVTGYEFTWQKEIVGKSVPKKSNVPNWADKPYKTQTTPEEQLRLDQLKKEILDDD